MKAAIEALRAQGAARLDPVHFRQIEAMARRAEGHDGHTRRLVEDRLQRLVEACAHRLDAARVAGSAAAPAPGPSPLAELLAHLAQHAAPPLPAASGGAASHSPAPVELKALRYYRSTWSRLSVDQRLTQSRSKVPEQAGPLNTQRLLHQALLVMREASPDYLHRFMQQVDALLWLDQASLGPATEKRTSAPAAPRRR
ncbi:Protein of unknown function (DUF2894) [Burkholderiales bacterium JOSHI_001]|nr:Protein of unknown function (DUF2894) [Burkholderiales bacterium JOSHI_001]